MGYSFRLTLRVILSSHRQDNTYHGIVAPVVGHWLEREIAQCVHHGATSRSIYLKVDRYLRICTLAIKTFVIGIVTKRRNVFPVSQRSTYIFLTLKLHLINVYVLRYR